MYEWTYEELLKANAVLDMYQSIDIVSEMFTEKEMNRVGGK